MVQVCTRLYTPMCVRLSPFLHVNMRTFVYVCSCLWTFVYVYTRFNMYVQIHWYMFVHVHPRFYTCVHVVHVFTRLYTFCTHQFVFACPRLYTFVNIRFVYVCSRLYTSIRISLFIFDNVFIRLNWSVSRCLGLRLAEGNWHIDYYFARYTLLICQSS